MSKFNSKSLGSLRQKLRKYNKDFEEEIAKFRENPDLPDEEDDKEKGTLLSEVERWTCDPGWLGFKPQ
jgi:Predicted Zn-dependent peptidases